jgi:hypothetical protein
MSRIPPALAARVDRLSRYAHRFHRFAHHPLCAEYQGELVPLGRRARVCRGCLLAGLGATAGSVASFLFAATATVASALLIASLSCVACTTVAPKPSQSRRPSKLLSRFLPAAAIAFAMGQAVRAGPVAYALVGGAAVGLVVLVALYRQKGPDRTPCSTCPERLLTEPCRGISPIIRREKAFRRLAGQWLARAGL